MYNFKLIFLCISCIFLFNDVKAEEVSLNFNSNTVTSQETEEMSDGTIKEIDWKNNTLLIKHGPLKNMKLPAMTMLFKVHEQKYMKGLKVGDDIFFKAEGNMRIIYLEKKK
jgi:Cu/Ag efflux protein CusF